MSNKISNKTKETAALYFKDFDGEKPYDLWKSFDNELAKNLSLFITGQMYSHKVLPHTTRQLITISALTVLGKTEELKLHIHASLNVGCTPREIAEVIFQTFTYAGIPVVNSALKTLRDILKEKKMWPIIGK